MIQAVRYCNRIFRYFVKMVRFNLSRFGYMRVSRMGVAHSRRTESLV